jgi:hypothetical protein
VDDPSADPDRPPGPVPGGLVGAAAGLLMSAVWAFGAWDVALALTAVFVSLVIVLTLGVPAWRPFGLGMLVTAAVVAGVVVLLAD